ncbi:MAG: hypothetical protein DRO12_01990 [Thermoprotei archaeon]|nr:MAG: hypothetical protein DRO12_01990 [Thermoprotei archaeon]
MEGLSVKVADYVVEFLHDKGYELVFGLPGWNILALYDALRSSGTEHMLFRHENSAAVAADVYGRLTGRPGVCIVTAGPGATNSVTGVAGAYSASSPMIHMAGHCSRSEALQPFHGVDDWFFLEKMFRPITKFSKTLIRASEVPEVLEKAYRTSVRGRPGPVHVSLPTDLLEEELEAVKKSSGEGEELGCAHNDLERVVNYAIKILPRSTKPIVIAGLGVLRTFTWGAVEDLTRRINAPVLVTRWGRSAVDPASPLSLDYVSLTPFRDVHPLIREIIEESDLVISIGLEAGSRRLLEESVKDVPMLHVYQWDGCPELVVGPRSIEIRSPSLRRILELLHRGLERCFTATRWGDVKNRVAKVREVIERELRNFAEQYSGAKPLHPSYVLKVLRDVAEENAIVTLDVGDNMVWAETFFRVRRPNSLLSPGRFGAMGFSLPAAIAAKKILGERQVLAITGDGGMLMVLGELATLAEQKLGVKVVVLNDGRYGMLWKAQRDRFSGRFIAVDTHPPNFAKCARLYGICSVKVSDPRELKPALEDVLSDEAPALIDVAVASHYEYYPYVV